MTGKCKQKHIDFSYFNRYLNHSIHFEPIIKSMTGLERIPCAVCSRIIICVTSRIKLLDSNPGLVPC